MECFFCGKDFEKKDLTMEFLYNIDRSDPGKRVSTPVCKGCNFNDADSHLICPSYPNCDIDPNGCGVVMGDDVEWYGQRD